MNRRKFLKFGNSLMVFIVGILTGYSRYYSLFSQSRGTLSFTDGAKVSRPNSKNIFQAQKISWEFTHNQSTKIWGFLSQTFAPPIVVNQEDYLDTTLYNQLASETLGLHWHGIRTPNNMDGVPHLTQPPIGLGENYRYRFASPDAGTFWYHTHSNSLMQLRMGLMGPLIVRETKPYPVDEDWILFLNDWSLNNQMQLDSRLVKNEFFGMPSAAHAGLLGNVITVNGKVNPSLKISPNSRLRFRLINAATARIFYINLPNEINPHFLALDGHPTPVTPYRKIAIAPGMRMDILADISSLKQEIQIDDDAYQRKEALFRIRSQGKPLRSSLLPKPQPLPNNPIPVVKPNQARRFSVVLSGGAMSGMGMMRGMMSGLFWQINGVAMSEDGDYTRPIFQVKKNQHVVLDLKNDTAFSHPIHLHGHTFFILSRNGIKSDRPRPTDTIFMSPREKAEIGFVADNLGRWMFHCHIIDHQVSGMMGFFEVG